MNTYITLFRGINVGGKNILPMKELKEILEGIGCKNVDTYIQSGNVVFQHEKGDRSGLAVLISNKINEKFQFEPKVLLLDRDEMEKAVAENPYDTSNGKILHFFFLDSKPESPDLDGLTALKTATEKFTLTDNVFYLYAPDGIGRSKLAAKVEKLLGVPTTARNWNTVSKLMEMI